MTRNTNKHKSVEEAKIEMKKMEMSKKQVIQEF